MGILGQAPYNSANLQLVDMNNQNVPLSKQESLDLRSGNAPTEESNFNDLDLLASANVGRFNGDPNHFMIAGVSTGADLAIGTALI